MKKLLLTLCIGTLILSNATSCKSDTGPTVLELLQGQWVCVVEDNTSLASDSIMVMVFNEDYSLYKAQATTDTNGNAVWQQYTDYSYSLDGSTLTVSSSPSGSVDTVFKAELSVISYTNLCYTITSYTIGGVSQDITTKYSFLNQGSAVVASFLPGVWGAMSSSDTSLMNIWEFSSEGNGLLYNYYTYNVTDSVYTVSYTDGYPYYVYGNYVVLNSPDPSTTGDYYSVWNVNDLGFDFIEMSNTSQDGTTTINTILGLFDLPTADTTSVTVSVDRQ